MRLLLLAPAFAFALGLASPAAAGPVSVEIQPGSPVPEPFLLSVTAWRRASSTREGSPGRPERVIVAFESISAEPRLAQVTAIEWRADAARLRMDDVERSSSESQTGGVIEWISGTLSVRDFLTLANARELRAALGLLEVEISAPDRAALGHFGAQIPPAPPAAPTP